MVARVFGEKLTFLKMGIVYEARTAVYTMMGRWPLSILLFLLCFGVACEKEPPLQTFQAHGIVESVEAEQGSIVIAHDEIPDFMQAMTMTFKVPHPVMLKNIQPGNEVNFTLMLARDGLYIVTIEPVAEKAG